jgi:NADH:ubiquinone oxidoreductase subunit 3 (subunit A)
MSLIVLLFFVPVLVAVLLGANVLLSTSRPDVQKLSVFECGLGALLNQTRSPFNVIYYLVAILFLLFDLEVLLLYPLAVTLDTVRLYGFWIAVAFFLVLTLGFIVELAYGVLYFTSSRSISQR